MAALARPKIFSRDFWERNPHKYSKLLMFVKNLDKEELEELCKRLSDNDDKFKYSRQLLKKVFKDNASIVARRFAEKVVLFAKSLESFGGFGGLLPDKNCWLANEGLCYVAYVRQYCLRSYRSGDGLHVVTKKVIIEAFTVLFDYQYKFNKNDKRVTHVYNIIRQRCYQSFYPSIYVLNSEGCWKKVTDEVYNQLGEECKRRLKHYHVKVLGKNWDKEVHRRIQKKLRVRTQQLIQVRRTAYKGKKIREKVSQMNFKKIPTSIADYEEEFEEDEEESDTEEAEVEKETDQLIDVEVDKDAESQSKKRKELEDEDENDKDKGPAAVAKPPLVPIVSLRQLSASSCPSSKRARVESKKAPLEVDLTESDDEEIIAPIKPEDSCSSDDLEILFEACVSSEPKAELDLLKKSCDVSLIASCGRKVSVHGSILSLKSKIFAAILSTQKDLQSKILEMSNVGYEALEELVHFFYTDKFQKADLGEDVVESLMLVAYKYEIDHLASLCKQMLSRKSGSYQGSLLPIIMKSDV